MSSPTAIRGQPVWELATLFPPQGSWSEEEYLEFDENMLVEFDDGFVEVLPTPTTSHQEIVLSLLMSLHALIESEGLGRVLMAPLKLRVGKAKYREPDILFVETANVSHAGEQFWSRADLVMEVVSPDDPERDYIRKRSDYARAGVAEYWIVDPMHKTITVLKLARGKYQTHGEFKRGEVATSVLLEGFEVSVTKCFSTGR